MTSTSSTKPIRPTKLVAAALFACLVGLTATACGDAQEAPDATSAGATPPSDRSVPVIGGPSPASTAPDSGDDTSSTAKDDDECGVTGGPDGALHVRLISGDVTCETAMSIAKEYSPLIATGQPQTVSGWSCSPSEVPGELSRCTRNNQIFAFTVT
ncbi:hypothetical protein [Gordonia caeni]|uniref:Secreted protein n=1 Tax=Gordonia caeni TaxID=1007097 RepID=A0ABP7NI28_9ACTN